METSAAGKKRATLNNEHKPEPLELTLCWHSARIARSKIHDDDDDDADDDDDVLALPCFLEI